MSQYTVVILLLGVIFTGAMAGIAMNRTADDADSAVAAYDFSLLARDASITGLHATVRKLANSHGMGTWNSIRYFENEPYAGGTFTVDVTRRDPSGGSSGDTVEVVARGTNGPAKHVIFARYARAQSDEGIPPSLRYAFISDFYMQWDGNVLITSTRPGVNASIHTNDTLKVVGNKFLVEGFGTYTEHIEFQNEANQGNNFLPKNDYNGSDPNYHQRERVEIDQLLFDQLRTRATESGIIVDNGPETPTQLTVNGDNLPLVGGKRVLDFTDPSSAYWGSTGFTYNCAGSNCGSESNPFVLFVDGTLEFLNTVEIIGHGYVIATGNVSVASQGTGGGLYGALDANGNTQVILGTPQNIAVGKAGGNVCLGRGPATYRAMDGSSRTNNHCQSDAPSLSYTHGLTLYANETISFNGTPYIVGGVVAHDTNMKGGGSPWLNYTSPSEATVDAGFEYVVYVGPILIAYSEFRAKD